MKTATITLTVMLAGALGLPAAMAAGPPSPPAAQAFELRMDGKSDEAKALLEQALAENERDASAWYELARTEMYLFQFDDAGDAIERAVALAPESARYHYLAGLSAGYNAVSKAHDPATRNQINDEMGKSLAAFEAAVNADPAYHEARIQLINMLIQAPAAQGGSRAKARKHVEFLEAKDAVYGVEARCMLDDVSDDKSVGLWEQVVERHPKRADAQAGLARAYLNDSRIDQAVAHIDKAIALDSSRCDLLLLMCRECSQMNDLPRAQMAAERYLQLEPPSSAPLRSFGTFYLAVLQKKQGNMEQADELLAEAKRIDPHCWTTFMEPNRVLFEAP